MGHRRDETDSGNAGLGGIFRSLGGFIDLLSNLGEQAGGEISRTGEIGDDKKGIKAVYGLTIRVGKGGRPSIERFGNVKDSGRGGPVVEEEREPMVDVFDEGDHLLLVAELPGVNQDEICFEVVGDVLNLTANHGEHKYRKEVILPYTVLGEDAVASYRNGVFELKLPRAE